MPNELTVIERQLQAVEPQLHNALSGLMPTKRLIQTVLISCESAPKLLACSPQSILKGAMTFAVLGLPVDGATGQGFLIPFGNKAQSVIGYRGYNTLGARAGLSITGEAVREDDLIFDYELGDKAFIKHKPRLGSRAAIIAFWAVATTRDRPPIVSLLSMSDVMAIKEKSPAVKAGADTPWNDPRIGFVAMGAKSAKRRLARSTPLITEAPQFMMAARMEEIFDEQGKRSWISPERGVTIEGETSHYEQSETPTAQDLTGPPRSGAAQGPILGPSEATGNAPASAESLPAGAGVPPGLEVHDAALANSARAGIDALKLQWSGIDERDRVALKDRLEAVHKPAAWATDGTAQTS